jgi:hypothetical protein
MTTVFVDYTNPSRPREIARDARDPFDHQPAIEQLADAYTRRQFASDPGRIVRVYASGLYVPHWRQNNNVLYESCGGRATEDFR